MNALLHSLNIGTLATWLSVGGFGTVGVLIPAWHSASPSLVPAEMEETWVNPEITLGEPGISESGQESAAPAEEPAMEADQTAEIHEPLPLPPEMPEVSEFSPLPEVPDLPPPPVAKPSTVPSSKPQPSRKPVAGRPSSTRHGGSAAASSHRGTAGSAGGSPGGTGMSNAARLAAGRMPPPSYPAEARRKGQTGTVIVEFTVDSAGRVISAHAKSPSPWPLLNNEAVRTVRYRWKFPPGAVMKLQRPIIFQLR